MIRFVAFMFGCALFTACTIPETPPEVQGIPFESLSVEYPGTEPRVLAYLNQYFRENACPSVIGFDSECTPSGMCFVSLTCSYKRIHPSFTYGYAFTVNFDLMCIEADCSLSTYR